MQQLGIGFFVRLFVSGTMCALFVSPPALLLNPHWYGELLLYALLLLIIWPLGLAVLMTVTFPLWVVWSFFEDWNFTPIQDLRDYYRFVGWYYRFLLRKPRPWLSGIALGMAITGTLLMLMNTPTP